MDRRLCVARGTIGGVLLVALAAIGYAGQAVAGQGTGLTVVVIEGKDAVNIIQQKTAVAPVVEVRDRNNQPVAGASATTIGVVSGAVAGGTLAVKEFLLPNGTEYQGPYAGNLLVVLTSTNPPVNCSVTVTMIMMLTMHLSEDNGTVHGDAEAEGTEGETATTCVGAGLGAQVENRWGKAQVSGPRSSITFTYLDDYAPGGGSTQTVTYTFTGAIDGNVITGTLTRTDRRTNPSLGITGLGSIAFPVTLHAR